MSDRERAHALLASWSQSCRHPEHNTDCDDLVAFAAEVRAETLREFGRKLGSIQFFRSDREAEWTRYICRLIEKEAHAKETTR